MARVCAYDLADESCLADGDVIFFRKLHGLAVGTGNVLAEHGAVFKLLVHVGCKLRAQSFGIISVNAGNRQQNGVCHIVKVSVLQHRAYYRVYRNVKLAAFKLHIAEHGFSVGIESLGREHVFVLVNVQFDAGVNIKGYDSCQSVGRAAAEGFHCKYACNYKHKHRG